MFYDKMLLADHRLFIYFDEQSKSGPFPIDFNRKVLQASTPFQINQIANNYFLHTKDYAPTDFGNLAPRYYDAWFEYRNPQMVNINGEMIDTIERYGDDRLAEAGWGIYVKSFDRVIDDSMFRHSIVSDDARWLCRSLVFFDVPGEGYSTRLSGMTWHLNEKGEILPLGNDPEKPYHFAFDSDILNEFSHGDIINHITGMMTPVFMSLAMIHCKNVRVARVPRVKGKRLRRLRQAKKAVSKLKRDESYHDHHIIIVDGTKTPSGGKSSKSSGKSQLAWHLMPCQFRTYGGTDPVTGQHRGLLFGKYAGTFFVPQHVRGTKAKGTITKEYHVIPEREN